MKLCCVAAGLTSEMRDCLLIPKAKGRRSNELAVPVISRSTHLQNSLEQTAFFRDASLLCSCLAVILLTISCATTPKQSPEENAATPVEVAAAKAATMHRIVEAEAVLYPINQATIVPKISAPVRRFNVQRGDHVFQGQLLAILEDRDLNATTAESRQLYRQAQANLEITRAATLPDDLNKAKTDLASAQEAFDASQKLYANRLALYKEGALAQKLVDDAKVALAQAQSQLDIARQHLISLQSVGQSAQLKSAEAQTEAAKAHYQSSAAQSSYSEIRSPISGVVADRGVNVGDMATSGAALFTIVDISGVVARANVSVNQASLLHQGQSATIRVANIDQLISGKVTVVSPSVDPNTTIVQVWIEVPNAHQALQLGASVTVSIDAGDVPNAISIPASALLSSDTGGEKVLVASKNSTAQERKVEVGLRNGGDVQILNGVNAGENVIVNGGLGLNDNARIEVTKPKENK